MSLLPCGSGAEYAAGAARDAGRPPPRWCRRRREARLWPAHCAGPAHSPAQRGRGAGHSRFQRPTGGSRCRVEHAAAAAAWPPASSSRRAGCRCRAGSGRGRRCRTRTPGATPLRSYPCTRWGPAEADGPGLLRRRSQHRHPARAPSQRWPRRRHQAPRLRGREPACRPAGAAGMTRPQPCTARIAQAHRSPGSAAAFSAGSRCPRHAPLPPVQHRATASTSASVSADPNLH